MSSVSTLLTAIQQSSELSCANFALILHDHFITYGKEVNLFWSSSWNESKILYLAIRYLASAFALLGLYAHLGSPTTNASNSIMLTTYILSLLVLILCQAVITLRVWYLFPRSPFLRMFAVAMYCSCTITTTVFASFAFRTMQNELTAPNEVKSPPSLVAIYVPSLVIHTVLFGLKLYRFGTSPKSLHSEAFLRRFLKEGMVMYAFATGSLIYTIVCLSLTSGADVPYYYSALQSGLPVGTITVCVCRAMLSIHSLAVTFHVDPQWLLNHAEMSRVPWTIGMNKNEIRVEVGEV